MFWLYWYTMGVPCFKTEETAACLLEMKEKYHKNNNNVRKISFAGNIYYQHDLQRLNAQYFNCRRASAGLLHKNCILENRKDKLKTASKKQEKDK